MNYLGKFAIPVLANDNPTGEVTAVTIVDAPQSGTAEVQSDFTILYTHTTGTPAEDSFTYRYTDDNGDCNPHGNSRNFLIINSLDAT